MSDDTRILDAVERGDSEAAGEFLPLAQNELRRRTGQTMKQKGKDYQLHQNQPPHWSPCPRFGLTLVAVLLISPAPVPAADGASALFATHCAPCHGVDGRARTPIGRKIGVKDLTQSKATDAEMEKQIREGKRDSRGERMPPFQGRLSDAEITALLAYAKSLRR